MKVLFTTMLIMASLSSSAAIKNVCGEEASFQDRANDFLNTELAKPEYANARVAPGQGVTFIPIYRQGGQRNFKACLLVEGV